MLLAAASWLTMRDSLAELARCKQFPFCINYLLEVPKEIAIICKIYQGTPCCGIMGNVLLNNKDPSPYSCSISLWWGRTQLHGVNFSFKLQLGAVQKSKENYPSAPAFSWIVLRSTEKLIVYKLSRTSMGHQEDLNFGVNSRKIKILCEE